MNLLDELIAWLDAHEGEDTILRRAIQASTIDRPFWRIVNSTSNQEDE